MTDLPLIPDFDTWPVNHAATLAEASSEVLSVTCADRSISQYHVLLLRENSPDAETIHPLAREMAIAPTDIPADLTILSAGYDAEGGRRFIEGIYSDRDELHSCIRMLKRKQRERSA